MPQPNHSAKPESPREPTPEAFQKAVLAWFDRHGRSALPWQQARTPYRVWVSEIMLQQTQVATVIDYFNRFMAAFPDVRALARAELDEVLSLWTGLGYYARARNLHKAARLVVDDFAGEFPTTVDELMRLPGVGRSTAGAIASLACGVRAPILDGNVKRVLARVEKVAGWPGRAPVEKTLWAWAEHYTPHQRVADYTPAMMDLGATVCTKANPACLLCPVQPFCRAHHEGATEQYPAKRPAKDKPVKPTRMLLLLNDADEVLLIQRPPTGVWGGLWSFPECPPDEELEAFCRNELGLAIEAPEPWPALRHTFSHFHLDITPVRARALEQTSSVMAPGQALWYHSAYPESVGLAAPVKRLMEQLGRAGE